MYPLTSTGANIVLKVGTGKSIERKHSGFSKVLALFVSGTIEADRRSGTIDLDIVYTRM